MKWRENTYDKCILFNQNYFATRKDSNAQRPSLLITTRYAYFEINLKYIAYFPYFVLNVVFALYSKTSEDPFNNSGMGFILCMDIYLCLNY